MAGMCCQVKSKHIMQFVSNLNVLLFVLFLITHSFLIFKYFFLITNYISSTFVNLTVILIVTDLNLQYFVAVWIVLKYSMFIIFISTSIADFIII